MYTETLIIHPPDTLCYPCGDCEALRMLSLSQPYQTGPDVTHLQELLIEMGRLKGPATGVYGPNTHAAVAIFQSDHGLPATGTVDLLTWELIGTEADAGLETAVPPSPPGFVSIVIDADRLSLTVFSDEEVWRKFTIASGKPSTPTPLGEWKIINKGILGGAFGTRWHGLSIPFGIYGIHGTNNPGSIGSHASKGCIRMQNRDVEILYRWTKTGTPVKIVGRPRPVYGDTVRVMRQGNYGNDVIRLQHVLKELGLYRRRIDGNFESMTTKAVREFQWASFLAVTGQVDKATREALKLP
jgi:peptidoglycan hydrolase-like protein with peptidoglycan-binding domain